MKSPACLQDPDVTLYCGDALAVLRELPAESVDCCVTSPPYWGLRDYGTGAWEGGDEACDHRASPKGGPQTFSTLGSPGHTVSTENSAWADERRVPQFSDVCGKCGAIRTDQQLGLESTPEEYVTRMVEVFREVRRVLASHGTVWLNLGDSYASSPPGNKGTPDEMFKSSGLAGAKAGSRYMDTLAQSVNTKRNTVAPGLKPKDLVGIPWRVAFALQADGWYLRSDIIWAKPNPMPESVTDRPTKAHEYVFLLSKQPRYFFDQEAVREKAEWARWGDQTNGKHEGSESAAGWIGSKSKKQLQGGRHARRYDAEEFKTTDERNTRFQGPNPVDGGRNIRSVWEIATQPYPEAHFATFPEELARRCIAAGCPEQVCRVCYEREFVKTRGNHNPNTRSDPMDKSSVMDTRPAGGFHMGYGRYDVTPLDLTDCGHSDYCPGTVLDPFMGSGTVAHVARKLGRHAIGIDLNADYLDLAARRLQQQSLFALDNGAERSPSAELTELEPVSRRRGGSGAA